MRVSKKNRLEKNEKALRNAKRQKAKQYPRKLDAFHAKGKERAWVRIGREKTTGRWPGETKEKIKDRSGEDRRTVWEKFRVTDSEEHSVKRLGRGRGDE